MIWLGSTGSYCARLQPGEGGAERSGALDFASQFAHLVVHVAEVVVDVGELGIDGAQSVADVVVAAALDDVGGGGDRTVVVDGGTAAEVIGVARRDAPELGAVNGVGAGLADFALGDVDDLFVSGVDAGPGD